MAKETKNLADRLANNHVSMIKGRILKNPRISEYNKGKIEEMVSWLESNDRDVKTTRKYLYVMEIFLKVLQSEGLAAVDFKDINKEQMQRIVADINKLEYGGWVKAITKMVVKTMWRHWFEDDDKLLHLVRVTNGIKISRPQTKVRAEDVLSEDDILTLLKACHNDRDMSIIATCYGCALRTCETGLRVKDVHLQEGYIEINSPKTGLRKVYLSSFETPYLTSLLNRTPKKPNDWLWTDWQGNRMTEDAIRMIVKRAGVDSGLSKTRRIWPYQLRHSRITAWVRRRTPLVAIKAQVGHSRRSNQIEATYAHLSEDDTRRLILEGSGDKLPAQDAPAEPKLIAQKCGWCGEQHEASATICPKVARPITLEAAQNGTPPISNREIVMGWIKEYAAELEQKKENK